MNDWQNLRVYPDMPIIEVIKIIDEGSLQVAVVVDSENRLLGMVSDGDVRRGILKGLSLDEPVAKIMNAKPPTAGFQDNRESILELMKRTQFRRIPIIDDERRVVSVDTLDSYIGVSSFDSVVLLMAGGMGTRLRPLTDECPKPLLKVGGKPLLETIVESFIEHGFRHFYFAVNYKADMIETYFGKGDRWGVQIEYIREKDPLGTAGALSMLPQKPSKPIIVMNGDLLTKVNFTHLLSFHRESRSDATMCVRDYSYQVPYGVVEINKHRLLGIREKPAQNFFVSAGIYVLNPEIIDLITAGSFCDMPQLFEQLIEQNYQTTVFPIREYWIDIGRMADFNRANGEFAQVFK